MRQSRLKMVVNLSYRTGLDVVAVLPSNLELCLESMNYPLVEEQLFQLYLY